MQVNNLGGCGGGSGEGGGTGGGSGEGGGTGGGGLPVLTF